MVQTLTVWSNGISEINTGTNFLLCNGIPFTTALQDKLDSIESTISAAGISQLHVEKDTFREFEHVVSAAGTVCMEMTLAPLYRLLTLTGSCSMPMPRLAARGGGYGG
jgi:hypothetical protein